VTSAAWGETLGRCAGLAYLWNTGGGPVDARWIGEGSYEVSVGGDVYPVTVSTKPPYDPAGHKIRA
jgi:4-methylaminobutanoate oxidase (formaldehyde-forming)